MNDAKYIGPDVHQATISVASKRKWKPFCSLFTVCVVACM